jgi:Rod binding domain-containing protein
MVGDAMRVDGLHNGRPAAALHNVRADATGQGNKENDKLRDVCEQFEAYFAAELLKTARENGHFEGMLKESRAEKVFGAQRDDELARVLGKRGALGIGRLLYDELSPRLEAAVAVYAAGKSTQNAA